MMASKLRWMMIPPSVVLMRLANDYVEFGEELKIEYENLKKVN